ncbi:MAG: hypothetical protein HPY50_08935 [Firmicutes bacterium]|nr:hypothetical protein [Bacillota bacterium]
MGNDWKITVEASKEYFLLKKSEVLTEYIFVRKPYGVTGHSKRLEMFSAASDKEAIHIGKGLARKYGLVV